MPLVAALVVRGPKGLSHAASAGALSGSGKRRDSMDVRPWTYLRMAATCVTGTAKTLPDETWINATPCERRVCSKFEDRSLTFQVDVLKLNLCSGNSLRRKTSSPPANRYIAS